MTKWATGGNLGLTASFTKIPTEKCNQLRCGESFTWRAHRLFARRRTKRRLDPPARRSPLRPDISRDAVAPPGRRDARPLPADLPYRGRDGPSSGFVDACRDLGMRGSGCGPLDHAAPPSGPAQAHAARSEVPLARTPPCDRSRSNE